jgi:hypothetical protein
MVYVVHDYDHVAYAGTSFLSACKYLKGSNQVQIWKDGQKVGVGDYDNKNRKYIKIFDK